MEIDVTDIEFNSLLEAKRHKELIQTLEDRSSDDDQFDKLLLDKRHKELLAVVKGILKRMNEDSVSKGLQELNSGYKELMGLLIDNNKENTLQLAAELTLKIDSLISKLEKSNNTMKQYEFDIIRDKADNMIQIKAKQIK